MTRRASHLVTLLVGLVLVVVMTYPTLPRATSVGRLDTSDGRYSIWNIAWLDHAVLTSPRHLLDGNIFTPHVGTLAYSELNLVAGLFGLPWYMATDNPLAALNGAVVVGLVAAFLCMAALVRRVTGSTGAGIVAATAFTFCPYVTAHTPHIQLLMVFVFPLVLLGFHDLAERPGPWTGVRLGVALAIAALASGYYGIFCGFACVWLALMWPLIVERPASPRRYVAALGAAVLVSVTLVGPVFVWFWKLRGAAGVSPTRHYDDINGWSANLASYLASSAVLHRLWQDALWQRQHWNEVLFPGICLLGLAGAAAVSAVGGRRATSDRRTRQLVWLYVSLAAFAVWISFGPSAGLWSVLSVFPGLSFLRAPARAGILAIAALCVPGGIAAARLGRGRFWVFGLMTVLVAAELGVHTEWGWPSWPLKESPPLSAAYRRLAVAPAGAVVEFPFPYKTSDYHNHTSAMYWSTYYWKPLVNGYSDVIPPDFYEIALPINGFPDPASFRIMRARQVRYVLWHTKWYGDDMREIEARFAAYPGALKLLVKTDDISLYEIVKWPEGSE